MKKIFSVLLLFLSIFCHGQTITVRNHLNCAVEFIAFGDLVGTSSCGSYRTKYYTIARNTNVNVTVAGANWAISAPPGAFAWKGAIVYSDHVNCPPTGSMTGTCYDDQEVAEICSGLTSCMNATCGPCGGSITGTMTATNTGGGNVLIDIN